MALASIRELISAYDDGRVHLQRFYKVAGLAGDNFWQDWAYATGQPGVNARVGDSATLTPFVAIKNQAIWFPGINTDQERRLSELVVSTTAGGASQASCNLLLYDLVAVYPLLDGDSTDAQVMDNPVALPRYADGVGVFPVLVNHVAAQTGVGTGVYSYVSCAGLTFNNVPFGVVNVGLGKAASASSQAGTATVGSLFMPSGGGCPGVRQITSLTFVTPPSGLWAIYMVKPLAWISNNDGLLVTAKIATERRMLSHNAGNLPRIYDGAHLGFFYQPNGGARTVAISGHAVFIWG